MDDRELIERAVQAAIDAGLAVNGRHGVAAARVAARFIVDQREQLAEEVRQIREAKESTLSTDREAVRAEAFEEAAKVCERRADDLNHEPPAEYADHAMVAHGACIEARSLASAIRALGDRK